MIIVYWTLVVLAAFAFALAVQMRVMIGIVLRRALQARFPDGEDAGYRSAVAAAANRAPGDPLANHLTESYPRPLDHLRMARRWSRIAPVLLLGLLLIGRYKLGAL